MAAKLLHTLADENPDLQKQIGCMTGIFQAFDRHHILTGRRTTHKRITLGSPHINSTNFKRELVDKFDQQRGSEKQRLSTDSSRLSFSSSCSSSLSSSEFNKGAQPETSTFDRIIFPETPSRDTMTNKTSAFRHSGHQSLDLRDVVRDSMHREARGLSAKTSTKKEEAVRGSKRDDTPRSADLKESLRFLAKLRDTPPYYNNELKDAKDQSWHLVPKDTPRFSVDSRDVLKSTAQKLKELPRLSLDSRGSSSSQKRPPSVVAKLMGLETLPGSPLARDKYSQLGMNRINPFENVDPFSKSLKTSNLNRPMRTSPSSPRSIVRGPTSPRWKNSEFIMKPISSARVPIEPAPWKQIDRNRVQRKQTSMPVKVPSRVPNSFPIVYSEIEKRLRDLEFKHSGKDLRALKQIMEAMKSKGFLETQKEAESPNFGTQRDYESTKSAASKQNPRDSSSFGTFESPIVIMKPAKLVEKAGIPASSLIPIHTICGLDKLQIHGAQDSKRSSKSSQTNKEESPRRLQSDPSFSLTDKKTATINSSPSSAKPQQMSKESSSKSLGSISPRLQQKKMEHDKRSRPPAAPSDLSNARRQSNQPTVESTSPGGKLRPKARHRMQQQNDDQLSQKSGGSRTSSHQGDVSCPQSDVEVTGSEPTQSAIEAAKNVVSGLMQNKSSPRLRKDKSLPNLSIVSTEHLTPISVLDNLMSREVASSPVKQPADNNKGNVCTESADEHVEDQWNPAYSFSDTALSGFSPEINRKKLQNIECLVQKLRRLNSTHDEASQDYIASLCENANPNSDHRYISEILLASGLLLRDLGSGLTTFQLHPSGHPINPELFLVLEQTKGNNIDHLLLCEEETMVSNCKKFHRKLVFDVVNEILVDKLASVGAITEPWMKSCKMMKTTMNAQQLLKELCSEIEQLQIHAKKRLESFRLEEENDVLKDILWEDVMIRSGKWTEFNGEIPGLVLDIERLLFKDLVDEIVHGEAGGLRGNTGKRRVSKNI